MKGKLKDELWGSSVAILAAFSALRNKLNNIWQQLKPKSNGLESRSMPVEAELCLLICSIFPDDSRIPVEALVAYGMGLSLFDDVHSISESRCRVYDLIKIINGLNYPSKVTGSNMRLVHDEDRPDSNHVELLVGARDLVKMITSSYISAFCHETIIVKWPESNRFKDCYGISLILKKVKERHVNLECPKLSLLQLHHREDSQTVPTGFFEGMKQLSVLSLDVPSLPQAIDVLKNLRTLRLKLLKCEDMSSIGGLINLEFLSIAIASLSDIPREMGQLQNLRLLDIREMNVQYFPPSVLSKLLKLEELYLPLSFISWGCKTKKYDGGEWCLGEEDNYDDEERINASLSEIISPSLNTLQVSVHEASVLPKKSMIFKNIWEFKILLPNKVRYQPFEYDSVNKLQLMGDASDILESGICDLMSRTEDLILFRVRNLKNVIYQLEDTGFPRLTKMIIAECDGMEYIVDTRKKQNLSEDDCLFQKLECLHLSMLSNLKGICNGGLANFQLFLNLSHVSIRFCHKLKYVFPLSVIKESMLLCIEVLDCKEMEGIFYGDNEEEIPLKRYTIEKLELHSLPKLFSLLVDGVQDNMIGLNASSMNGSYIKKEELVIEQLDSSKPVSPIKVEEIIHHMELSCAFPSKLAEKWLKNLKRLKIAFCTTVEVIFLFEKDQATSRAFDSLKELELHGLPNLVHIWYHIPPKTSTFQNLQLLVLSECGNSYLFSRQVAKSLAQLQKLYVSRCEKMEEIILKDEKAVKGKILFPRLGLLELQRMPNLRAFSRETYEIGLPLLESMKLNQCSKMNYFSEGVLRTPMLQRVEINGSLCSLTGDLNSTMKRLFCRFSYADMKTATRGWRPDNLLGTGDFGEMYKGWLGEKTLLPSRRGNGMMIAIKRFDLPIQKWLGELQLEVEFLENLSHPNLTKLLGHCWEDNKLFFVYEFIERRSLDICLFRRSRAYKSLSWDMRIKIAMGAAQGLDFLHSKNVIHRDIKSSNILLDRNYNAKLVDYGLTITWWLSDEYTNTDMDISGYAAPESFEGHLQAKSDVYSFGVVLLELMTGLKAVDKNRATALVDMFNGLKPIHKKRRQLQKIMDVRINGQYPQTAILLAAELALNCIEYDPENRPSMKEVVGVLQQICPREYKPEGLELCTVSP